MKKNKISKNWISRQKNDIYVQKSKQLGYRSRSAIKLIEINQKFNFFPKCNFFLDLGSAPGGWSQVASDKIKNGKILSVDTKDMLPINKVKFLKGDFTSIEVQNKIINFFNRKIDVIVSDMASNTTGNKAVDSIRTGNLCLNALEFSYKFLNFKGIFISKIFMGSVFKEIQYEAKKIFKKVSFFKPRSSRQDSKEIYIFCKDIGNLK